MEMPPLRLYPGYQGHHTRDEAEGALPNGTRVSKCNSQEGDSIAEGIPGVILGSFRVPTGIAGDVFSERGLPDPEFLYFVEWDTNPKYAVGTVSVKVEALDEREED